MDLDQRMTGLQTDIATALLHNRQYLQSVATGIVDQHQTQLDRMRAKALLSIARLQDRGYVQERERQGRQPKEGLMLELQGQPATPATPDAGKPDGKKGNGEPDNLTDVIRNIFSD